MPFLLSNVKIVDTSEEMRILFDIVESWSFGVRDWTCKVGPGENGDITWPEDRITPQKIDPCVVTEKWFMVIYRAEWKAAPLTIPQGN